MSRAAPRHFTEAEDREIIRRYSRETFTQIGERVGRPRGIIQQRISILVRTGRLDPRKRFYQPRWTEKDIAFLERNRGLIADAEIARRLHRSVVAVVLKGKRLNLMQRDSFLTAKQVAEVLGVDQKKVVWLHGHGALRLTKSSVRSGDGNLCWRCDYEELDRFLRKETHWYDYRRVTDPIYRDMAIGVNRDPWLTLPQAARIVRMTQGGLANYVASGEIPSVKVPGAGRPGYHYRVKRSALQGFRPKRPELVGHIGRGKVRKAAA